MSFINNYSTIIRRSNKDMFYFHLKENLVYDYFDNYGNLVSSTPITKSPIDFTSSYFTLGKDDSIYGIYKDNSLKMFEIKKNNTAFLEKEILTYNHKKFNILFPYINNCNDDIHILYYLCNNNSTNTCALFHHYNHNGIWTENKIDFINHMVLDNFVVLWVQDSPIIFYLNLINGYEEVFLSRFNYSTLTWCSPIQITNSKKNKIYLSVLKDNLNFYHLTFCEKSDNGYAVKYVNGFLMENKLDINVSKYITGPSTCMYPSLMKNKSNLYLMWVNYGKLNTSVSDDLGKTWGDHEVDDFSIEEEFTRAKFISNYEDDLSYNVSSVFTTCDDVGILGF